MKHSKITTRRWLTSAITTATAAGQDARPDPRAILRAAGKRVRQAG